MVRALEAAGSSPPPDLLQRRTRHERAMRVSPCAAASSSIACSVPASSETLALASLPLSMRKASLSRLLARRVDGIFLSDFGQGEIGPDLFRHAYRGGRSDRWIKVKNRQHPAFACVRDQFS